MRLLQPSNSKGAKRKGASFYSWKKKGKRKKEKKRSTEKLETLWLSYGVRMESRCDGGTQGYPFGHSGYLSRGTQHSVPLQRCPKPS